MGQRREGNDEVVEDVARDRLGTTEAESLQRREDQRLLDESDASSTSVFIIGLTLARSDEEGIDKFCQGIDKDTADATCEIDRLEFCAVPAAFTFLKVILGDCIESGAENSSSAKERSAATEEELLDDGRVKRAVHVFCGTERF